MFLDRRRLMFWRKKKTGDGKAGSSAPTATSPSPDLVPLSLEAAIDSASFVLREFNDEDGGARIAVLCDALGGPFIYSAEAVERRIRSRYPELADGAVRRATRHMGSMMRIYMKPIRRQSGRDSSWVHGWAE